MLQYSQLVAGGDFSEHIVLTEDLITVKTLYYFSSFFPRLSPPHPKSQLKTKLSQELLYKPAQREAEPKKPLQPALQGTHTVCVERPTEA